MSTSVTGELSTPATRYRVVVAAKDGGSSGRLLDAHDAGEALARCAQQGLRVLSIQALSSPHAAMAAQPSPRQGATPVAWRKFCRSRFPALLFTQELLALLDAGLHVHEALVTLHAKSNDPAGREVLQRLLDALRQGRRLSDALDASPEVFPTLLAATVRAAERSGDLSPALTRYNAYQIQIEALRSKLMSAALYPAILLGVGGAVIAFLLAVVVPRFASVYGSSGRTVPWMSRLLLDLSEGLRAHGALTACVMLALGVGFTMLARFVQRQYGVRFSGLSLIPGARTLSSKISEFRLARFYRSLSLLTASGITLPQALTMSGALLNDIQRHGLSRAVRAIEQGQRLSDALQGSALTTPVTDSLVKVGERSGQLSEMLERCARFMDDDLGRWLDWGMRLVEPILMLIIGLVIGAVVILMYIPIFELAGSL